MRLQDPGTRMSAGEISSPPNWTVLGVRRMTSQLMWRSEQSVWTAHNCQPSIHRNLANKTVQLPPKMEMGLHVRKSRLRTDTAVGCSPWRALRRSDPRSLSVRRACDGIHLGLLDLKAMGNQITRQSNRERLTSLQVSGPTKRPVVIGPAYQGETGMSVKMPMVGVALGVVLEAFARAKAVVGTLAPSRAWTFERALSPAVGTGHAESAAPGLMVATESLAVPTWVSLTPPRLLGWNEFAAALRRAGSEGFRWSAERHRSLRIDDAGSNRRGHAFGAPGGQPEPDPDPNFREMRLEVDERPAAQPAFNLPKNSAGASKVGRLLTPSCTSCFPLREGGQ